MNFKIIQHLMLLEITGFCLSVLGAPGNIVRNPGFENSLKGWYLWPVASKIQCKIDENESKSGKCSCRIVSDNFHRKAVFYTNIRLQGGKNYCISFWYKLKDFTTSQGAGPKIVLNFKKQDGINKVAGKTAFDLPLRIKENLWCNFTREFSVPENAVAAQLQILALNNVRGTIWIDDVSVNSLKDDFAVFKTPQPPHIDGILNDGCWKKTGCLTGFYRMNDRAVPAVTPTKAYICYDNSNIYIAFVNNEPFINMLKAGHRKLDAPIWNDDCNEVFLASPNGKVRQFVVNAANSRWDGDLYMRVPGDPYRSNAAWNGKWSSAVGKKKDKWITEIAIPLENFDYSAKGVWKINLARERHGAAEELTHWARVDGTFKNVFKFNNLQLQGASSRIIRFSEDILKDPFFIKREKTAYSELLSAEKGNYIVGSWGHGYVLSEYPYSIRAKYSQEKWRQEQKEIFRETGLAGMFGPAFPWVDKNLGGMQEIKELSEKYGMKFVLSGKSSSLVKEAVKNGAVFQTVDSEMAKVMHNFLRRFLTKRSEVIAYLAVINGEDEPTNSTYNVFSLTANAKNREKLEIVDAKVKKEFGNGRFGLYDKYAPADQKTPFNHIAFWSWWSEQYCKIRKEDLKTVKQLASGVPYLINFNSCSSFNYPDFTLISYAMDYISCDPYPSSAMASYGRDRALYHTGFATRLLHDIAAPGVKTCVMPQGFIYHGRGPTPANIREWASQAMKNGASMLYWYAPGPLRVTIPASYKEMLRINNIVRSMNKIKMPEETVTAVFYSQSTRKGIMDRAQYSLYSLYVILGEKLKTWFRFVNETMLDKDIDSLSRYSLIYVPELKYVDDNTAKRLLKFVENGGTLVLFDPESFKWNINGSSMKGFHEKFIGAQITDLCEARYIRMSKRSYQMEINEKLPLTPVRGRERAGKIIAYNIVPPKDAEVFAAYPDGKPAAFERKIGKGKVIYFAAQPFGNAWLAVHNSNWINLFRSLANSNGEKQNLPIWDFMLPTKGGEVNVKYILPPHK